MIIFIKSFLYLLDQNFKQKSITLKLSKRENIKFKVYMQLIMESFRLYSHSYYIQIVEIYFPFLVKKTGDFKLKDLIKDF